MLNRNYCSYKTNFGDVNIANTDYIVRDVNVEQKYLQKMIVPLHSMVFLISENDDSFTYSFLETEYTIFMTREKIESVKYGYPTNNHDWCCYAETRSTYIVLPSIEIIKKRNLPTGDVFSILR